MSVTSQDARLFHDYDGFVAKFKRKPPKTTDDCYTPPEVYDVVRDWAVARYGITGEIVRPFWPGADYQAVDYPDGCTVIDNPPFSIITSIVKWYVARGIPFFLFCHANSCLGLTRYGACVVSCALNSIVYTNGAVVRTAFATNMGDNAVETAPELGAAIKAAQRAVKKAGQKPQKRYIFPANTFTTKDLLRLSRVPFAIRRDECAYARNLDVMEAHGSRAFGGVLLLNDAAERRRQEALAQEALVQEALAQEALVQEALAQEALVQEVFPVELSDEERHIVATLNARARAADGVEEGESREQ